jgi:hypothetical protein
MKAIPLLLITLVADTSYVATSQPAETCEQAKASINQVKEGMTAMQTMQTGNIQRIDTCESAGDGKWVAKFEYKVRPN